MNLEEYFKLFFVITNVGSLSTNLDVNLCNLHHSKGG
jgi:hypothetical protein